MPAADFEGLADALPEAYLLIDRSGVVRAANAAAARLFETGGDAMVGRRLDHLVLDPEPAVNDLLRLGGRTRTLVPCALTLRRVTGPGLACRCEVAALRPRTPEQEPLVLLRLCKKETAASQFVLLNERIEALAREIGRRRIAESALQAYSERLRVTLRSMGDAMIATDMRGGVVMMNGVAESMTGWSEAEAEGRPLEDVFVIVNQHTRLRVDNPVARVLREGVIVGLANHTVLIARDGTERAIDDSGAPIRDGSGRLTGAVLLFRDITERYAMEQALQRQTAALIESDKRKDEFLSMLAHELRNPLAPLQNGIHLLAGGTVERERVVRTVQMLQRQLGHLTRLVDDLLDVARISRGRIELKQESVALDEIVRQAIEMARPLMEARRHELKVSSTSSGAVLQGDPARLVQVLTNLLSNAAKFSPERGRIELSVAVESDDAVLSVRDHGTGIEPALLPRVFDMFVQADTSLDRSQGGLGIGLFVVRAIIEMHGGTVHAHSGGAGQGSTFVVRLPLPSSAFGPEHVVAAARATAPPRAARRVLVVDDNIDAGESLGQVLELWGHQVVVVASARAALDAWPSLRPDVALIDIGLPEMNGCELARRIRQLPGAARAQLIAVTGYGQAQDRQATSEAGFHRHLTKPVELEVLTSLLAGVPLSPGR